MIAGQLLSRLDSVRRIGPDRWRARCPAHDDRHPSLSIRECTDGKVLLKCWAGCTVHEIVTAVGLRLDDLFPARPTHRGKPAERRFPAADLLQALAHEATVIAIAASRLANAHSLTDEDRERVLLASERILTAVAESGHA